MSAIATYTARHNTYYTTYVLINDICPTSSIARHSTYYTTYDLINDICPTSSIDVVIESTIVDVYMSRDFIMRT